MASFPSFDQREQQARQGGFLTSLQIQQRVIGALILRELHTRFGRSNIGYLWMIGEPMLLATVIGIIHASQSTHYDHGMAGVPFGIIGYCTFIIFRGIFGRSEGAISANQSLLYHRNVTVLDIMIAKAVVEAVGCVTTLIILLGFCMAIGMADPPARLLYMFAGIGLMIWWSFAMGMICVAYTYDNHVLGRLVHPFGYFMMPLSGMAFALEWLPAEYRNLFMWNPMVHIFEITRHGWFAAASDKFFSFGYVLSWTSFLTFWGLTALRRVRRKISL